MNCDCGQPATRKDGSGWFCQDCAVAVSGAQAMLAEFIRKQRHEDDALRQQDRRNAWQREYAAKHRDRIKAYQKKYQKKLCKSEI